MTRNFYSSASFFTALYITVTFFENIIFIGLGEQLSELHSLGSWIILSYMVSLVWSLTMLKYYRYRQYWFTFWTGAISIPVSLFHFIMLYNLIATLDISIYYIIATLLTLGTGTVYGISLIFSVAGKRPWLRASGVFLLFLGLAMISSFILAINFVDLRLNGTLTRVDQWTRVIGSLAPVLFIMNFLSERSTAEKMVTSRQESLQGLLNIVAFAAVVSVLVLGSKVAIESLRLSGNPDHVSEDLKRLASPYEARTYVNSRGDTLRYRLMIPKDYDSTSKYPLVVCLHGASGRGRDNVKQVVTSFPAQLLSNHENRTKYPTFLFVPQCPPRAGFGGIEGLPAVDSLVFETIIALEDEFAIDVDRCYVSGNSLGGAGTWHFICKRPEMFAAAIPVSGDGNPALAHKIVGMPVWAFHGSKDRIVPVSGSQEIIEAIKNLGGSPRYTEFPDEGRHIWNNVTDTPSLLDWLFAQKRGAVDY
jgi:pimeloyl-ACP methyl ester carboxylesterase